MKIAVLGCYEDVHLICLIIAAVTHKDYRSQSDRLSS